MTTTKILLEFFFYILCERWCFFFCMLCVKNKCFVYGYRSGVRGKPRVKGTPRSWISLTRSLYVVSVIYAKCEHDKYSIYLITNFSK